MCRYGEYPQFDAFDALEMARMIKLARLSPIDRNIATGRLINRQNYADIGAQVRMDRTAVSYRLRHIIIPRLEGYIQTHANANALEVQSK
jgi:hypothetical protein